MVGTSNATRATDSIATVTGAVNIHDRGELKAARMVAILQMQDRLTGIPKVRIAAKAADLTKLLQELVDLEQWDNNQKAGE